ncbi:mucin-2-like isoform X1, partial [Clarias magur]
DENQNEVTLILRDMNVTEKDLKSEISAQQMYSIHTVGLYIIISVNSLGLNVIWDKQTRVKIELQTRWI